MQSIESLVDISQSLLSKAQLLGVEASVSMSQGTGFDVQVWNGCLESFEHHQDQQLSVTIYHPSGAKGSASSSDFQHADEVLERAFDMAQHTEGDPFEGLPDAKDCVGRAHDADGFDPWDITAQQAVELCLKMEEAGFSYRPEDSSVCIVNSEGASCSTYQSHTITSHTRGFLGSKTKTKHSLQAILIAKKDRDMERDFEYTIARKPQQLQTPEWVGKQAARYAAMRVGAQSLSTRKSPVIFSSRAAKNLLGDIVDAISGYAIYKNMSFLSGKINEIIASPALSMQENPHQPGALYSSTFDAEGLPTKPQSLIQNGRLCQYILNTYTARRLNQKSTAHAGGVRHLTWTHEQTLPFDQLLRLMNHGLYVWELIGSDVDITTGQYSLGVFGFWVENGKIKYPVSGMTIASHLGDMLHRIRAMGDDIDHRGRLISGSVMVDEMMIAGTS